MTETQRIVDTLKAVLRSRRITYADVARELELSEATVKRLFSRATFTLERLEQVCDLAGLRVTDLARRAELRGDAVTRLTAEQEQELLADPKLLLVAYLVLNHWRFEEIVQNFRLSSVEIIGCLAKLDRLRMIELLPGNRVRRLVARNFTWRRDGPVHAYFQEQVKDFLDSRFATPTETLHFTGARLSRESIERVTRSVAQLVRDVDQYARMDAELPAEAKRSVGTLIAVRPWEVPAFRALRR